MGGALVLVVALASVVAACTSGPTSTEGVGSSPAAPTSPSPAREDVFVRRCGTDVYGDLGSDWRSHATNFGQLHLLYPDGYQRAPSSSFDHPPGRLVPLKILAVVDEGGPVVAWVPMKVRNAMGLVYDPDLFDGRLRPEAYDGVVRFVPCEGRPHPTQFNGGIAVVGPGCYPLMVRSDDDVGKLRLPLGEPCD
jgi:hypothetical protein